jgi:hypothetical protein
MAAYDKTYEITIEINSEFYLVYISFSDLSAVGINSKTVIYYRYLDDGLVHSKA